MKTLLRLLRQSRGYTTVELIVAMSIFAVVIVIATGSFVSVQRSSNKTGAQRTVQQEARYNIEEIARQTRSSSINYGFYKQGGSCAINQVPGGGTNASAVLALLYTEASNPTIAQPVYFFVAGAGSDRKLYRYETTNANIPCNDLLSTNLDAANKVPITNDKVKIESAGFAISPINDPQAAPPALGADPDPASKIIHPRVTAVFNVAIKDASDQSRQGNTTLQTTISTRAYPVDTPELTFTPPAPDQLPVNLATSYDSPGRDFSTCTPPIQSFSCAIQGSSVYSYGGGNYGYPPWVVSYQTPLMADGAYALTLSYQNLFNQDYPQGAPLGYVYGVRVYVDGVLSSGLVLPVTGGSPRGSQEGTAPGSITLTGNKVHTITFEWFNDFYNATGDANLMINRVQLRK